MHLFLSHSLFEMVNVMDQKADELLKQKFNISFSHFYVLANLLKVGPASQHALAQCMRISDPAVSRLVIKMQEENYITVKVDPLHGKKRIVDLTDSGRKLALESCVYLEKIFIHYVTVAGVDPEEYGRQTQAINKMLNTEEES